MDGLVVVVVGRLGGNGIHGTGWEMRATVDLHHFFSGVLFSLGALNAFTAGNPFWGQIYLTFWYREGFWGSKGVKTSLKN